jgi:hypothetical protein
MNAHACAEPIVYANCEPGMEPGGGEEVETLCVFQVSAAEGEPQNGTRRKQVFRRLAPNVTYHACLQLHRNAYVPVATNV